MGIKHVLFIALKPHQVNGELAAHDGRLLIRVDNYFEVHQEAPKITDGISQVFQVEVDDEELAEVAEGPIKKLLLWKGDVNSRSRPQDKHQLPIMSLIPLGDKGTKAAAAKT